MTRISVDLYDKILSPVHAEWQEIVGRALQSMSPDYLQNLSHFSEWLPGAPSLLNAFSQPRHTVRYLLMGESPYPRRLSANGYAFWDAQVNALWSGSGLSREVNRATSLRNFLKMLLHAEGVLDRDFSKDAISRIDKGAYYQTASEFFKGLLTRGFLLLNATLVFEKGKVSEHAKMWRPFLGKFLELLAQDRPHITLILFGKVAELVPERHRFDCMVAEHPYNLSFITNPDVIAFFKPLKLLYPL
jgi:uracil-DNA glycosylase